MANGMTFKNFLIKTAELPATAFSGMVDWLLGSTETDEKGRPKLKDKKPIENNGLLGLLMDGVKAIGRGISGFIKGHKQAIATAFWLSLLVGGGLALAFYLLPSFLATVANFSLYGYSVASVAGADPLLQMWLAAGLAATATSAVVYVSASVVNFINGVKDFIYPPADTSGLDTEDEKPSAGHDSHQGMMKKLANEAAAVATQKANTDAAPATHASPINSAPEVEKDKGADTTASPAPAV